MALKALAQTEDTALAGPLRAWARALFRSIDSQHVIDGEREAAELLSAVARRDAGFLRDVLADARTLPSRNV